MLRKGPSVIFRHIWHISYEHIQYVTPFEAVPPAGVDMNRIDRLTNTFSGFAMLEFVHLKTAKMSLWGVLLTDYKTHYFQSRYK